MRFVTTASVVLFVTQSVAVDWCPGVLQGHGGGTTDNYCCVGAQLTLSTCPGWPICTGSGTVNPATTTQKCSASIPVTASNYDELVSSASAKYLQTDGGDTPATATAGESGSDATSTSGASLRNAGVFAPLCVGMMAIAALA